MKVYVFLKIDFRNEIIFCSFKNEYVTIGKSLMVKGNFINGEGFLIRVCGFLFR